MPLTLSMKRKSLSCWSTAGYVIVQLLLKITHAHTVIEISCEFYIEFSHNKQRDTFRV